MIIYTPKNNIANVEYTYEGIPTDGLIPLYLGYTIENKIIIQPHLKDDEGLLLHELVHVDQWYNYYWFKFRYNSFKNFKYKMEVEAFANQLTKDFDFDKKLTQYANELSTHYNINKNFKRCIVDIENYYTKLRRM